MAKTYRPVQWGGAKWEIRGFGASAIPYNLDQISNRLEDGILVVEGEKAADAAKVLFPNLVATTWPGGANAVEKFNVDFFIGRDVTIFPDADGPGKTAAKKLVVRLLEVGAKSVRLVEVPDWFSKGWDVADEAPDGVDINAMVTGAVVQDDTYLSLIRSARQLSAMNIPEREYIVSPFLPTGGLAMIFAARGIGKTWIALSLAIAVARGDPFLAYDVPQPRRVLFIDGEMALTDLVTRLRLLGSSDEEMIEILPSELMFQNGKQLNINDEKCQEVIFKTLAKLSVRDRRPELIIIDNLSSLGGGIDENDNSALEKQLQFLIKLRHLNYAVCIIHHAGKSGEQRGASRREDLLDTSIKLELPKKDGALRSREGAAFTLEFVKTRGERPRPELLNLELVQDADGILVFKFDGSRPAPPYLRTLRLIYEGVLNDNLKVPTWRPIRNQSELTDIAGQSKGNTSKHIKVLQQKSFCAQLSGGQGLGLYKRGVEELQTYFSDLHQPLQNYHVLDDQYSFDDPEAPI